MGYTGGFRIKITDHEHKHVGLGSTSTVMIAVATAMNEAVGSPLSTTQLRHLIGHNYVEETTDGRIAFGFETGVGPAVSINGGMAVMGDELSLVYHHPFAEGKNVFIIIPPTDTSSHRHAGIRSPDEQGPHPRLPGHGDSRPTSS